MAGVRLADAILLLTTLLVCVSAGTVMLARLVLLKRWGRKHGKMAQAAERWAEEYRWITNYMIIYALVSFTVALLSHRAPLNVVLLVVAWISVWGVLSQWPSRVMARLFARMYFGVSPEEPRLGLWEPVWPLPLRKMPPSESSS